MRTRTETAVAAGDAANARAIPASQAIPELGPRLILWGWITAMVGVVGYCRVIFAMSPDTGALDALFHSGVIGWISSAMVLAGVSMWLMGNLIYLRDAMDAPAPAAEPTDPSRETGMPGKEPRP